MPTSPRFGPADHGRRVSETRAGKAEYVGGFRYEIIHGRLYVTPMPEVPENVLENWLRRAFDQYAEAHPAVVGFVATKARVYVPEARRATIPEPDIAVYKEFPEDKPLRRIHWRDISPLLVTEVMVDGEFEKDLSRNPVLYLAVPSVREYWVLNGSEDVARPSIIRHRRRGERWEATVNPFGSTLTTPVLPGFELLIDPKIQ